MLTIAFLDIETTGLPERRFGQLYAYNQIEKYDSCRIVQIALNVAEYCAATGAFEIITERNFIIKPAGFLIQNTAFHGITHERAVAEGALMQDVAAQLKRDLNKCALLVAHNIEFDKNVLLSELFRIDDAAAVVSIKRIKTFCTMMRTTDLVKMMSNYGSFKWPKLTELHYFLFRTHIADAHNAKNDVDAVTKCFAELLRHNLITL